MLYYITCYIFATENKSIYTFLNINVFKFILQIYKKKMKVSKIIIEKILNDNNFSIELAKRLGNQQQSVLGLARRNSRNLTLW